MVVPEREPAELSIAADVLRGLTRRPKSLPPKLFYDAEGSALFEQITELPEYYLTRTERAILQAYADRIVKAAGSDLTLVELGAGTASKTNLIIRALLDQQQRATYYPVDVSRTALDAATAQLNGEFPALTVKPIVADYSEGLADLAQVHGQKLILYIGSSIGNFEPMQAGALLHNVRQSLRAGDALLLGVDVVKHPSLIIPAYNDSQGVTARFNKNMLARINRELGGHFDLDSFLHVAQWNALSSRIEIYLESVPAQKVPIDALEIQVEFQAGERIHTENSYKFTASMLNSVLHNGGFVLENTWSDSCNWFALHLARVD